MYEIHNLIAEAFYLKSCIEKQKATDINDTNPEKIILQNRLVFKNSIFYKQTRNK